MPDDAGNKKNHHPLGIVVAMTAAGVIGRDGKLPWDLPEDRRLFRQLTLGGTVIMGRRTFASLPAPLANRVNIVVSRSARHIPGVETVPDLPTALALARDRGRPTFVIGGVELYRAALPVAERLYISWVAGEFPGDRYFPPLHLDSWQIVSRRDYPGFCHITYQRT
jgi:dihydrofolate reductase